MDYINEQIMEQSRHQFIYGYDGAKREEFLRSLEKDYPIKVNENLPMAIYMKDFSLPVIDSRIEYVDKMKLLTISREFFNFSLVYNIIDRIINQANLNILDIKIDLFLKRISRINLTSKISDLNEMLDILKQSRDFYVSYYLEYLKGESVLPDINDIKIPFLELNNAIMLIKMMLNNRSYFGVIIDKQCDIPVISMKAINSLVTRRINSNISMKIACDPDKWNLYYDLNGVLEEEIRDYGTIELDDSASKYLNKIKSKRSVI